MKSGKDGGTMKTKKRIITCVFLLLILITAVVFAKCAIDSYNYEIDLANGIDIMEGMAAAMLIIVGGFLVFYELDLFCTVYYFLIKPKTVAKTILNIFSHVSLLLVFFNGFYKDIFEEDVIAPMIMFCIYVILRTVYFIVSAGDSYLDP
jgi:hypothetical protein